MMLHHYSVLLLNYSPTTSLMYVTFFHFPSLSIEPNFVYKIHLSLSKQKARCESVPANHCNPYTLQSKNGRMRFCLIRCRTKIKIDRGTSRDKEDVYLQWDMCLACRPGRECGAPVVARAPPRARARPPYKTALVALSISHYTCKRLSEANTHLHADKRYCL